MVAFLRAVWQVLLELAPWLLVGAFVAGAIHVLLPASLFRRQFAGSLGVFKAVLLGVPLPLCSCAVIPVGLGLRANGASRGASVAFLISTPQTGVDSILVSGTLLSWPFAVFKLISAAVTGVVGGWWVDREQDTSLPIVQMNTESEEEPPNKWTALLSHSVELLRAIWRWLLFGVLVSAAITTFASPKALSGLGEQGDLVAMFATLAIALPLYVCATASVPIAAALVASGLPVGAALVFLMAGPATNLATIGAVYASLGRRALAIYLTTVIVGSIGCGYLFGHFIDSRVSTLDHLHHSSSWWSTASAIALAGLLAWFAFEDLTNRSNAHAAEHAH